MTAVEQELARLRRFLTIGAMLAAVVVAAAVLGWVQLYLAVNDICAALNDLAGPDSCGHLDGWGQ